MTQNGAAAAGTCRGETPWRKKLASLGRELVEGARSQWLILAAVAVYLLASYAAASLAGAGAHFSISLYSLLWVKLTGVFVFGVVCILYPLAVLILVRPARPLRHIWEGWRRHFFNVERIKRALPLLILLPVFMSGFSSMKAMIPVFDPYTWDLPLAQLDRWLHGGVDPWLLLQPWLGKPAVTHAINAIYNLWFFIIYGVTLWQIFRTRDLRTRAQYLLSFVLAWGVLGTLMASLFASGGPCYYEHFAAGENPFAPLMSYLYQVDETHSIWALQAQEMLWRAHSENDLALGGGISAMPSLHVACALLCALVGWRTNRVLGWIMTAFVVATMIGSVHLGWHYAVDGYASLLLLPPLWWAAGWMVDRWGARWGGLRAAAA
ncbi:MAG: phosphatase PAP2 family protein [Rhodovibrionaceae bacterium]